MILTRFYFYYVDRSKDTYYMTNWDNKREAEIISDTKANAVEKLEQILGDPGYNRVWAIALEKIVQEPAYSQQEVGNNE